MGKLIRFRRKAKPKARDEAARALFPPFLSSAASDARPSSVKYDAATSDDGVRLGVPRDPEIERKKVRKQRSVVIALVLLFVGGTAAALFGDRGYLDVKRQQLRFRELKEMNATRLTRVDALRHEIDRLRDDPSAVERIAREDLGFVAKGEITLLLPAAPGEAHGLDANRGSGIVPAVRKTP
jgi:cell division protein FtsB